MSTEQRTANYVAQNGSERLTARQLRSIRKHQRKLDAAAQRRTRARILRQLNIGTGSK